MANLGGKHGKARAKTREPIRKSLVSAVAAPEPAEAI